MTDQDGFDEIHDIGEETKPPEEAPGPLTRLARFIKPEVRPAETTDAERANGWTEESLAVYLAERNQAAYDRVFNRGPKRPNRQNIGYNPKRPWSR